MKYPLTTMYAGFMEGLPIFHFSPGARAMSIGTYGCNLDCRYCMNQHLLNEPANFFDLSPQQIVDKAAMAGCRSISFSANEPAVSFDYFMDICAAARAAGMAVGCSSNGLFSGRQLELVRDAIGFANISLKGPDEQFYREICGGGSPEKVLETIRVLHAAGVHVEVTTPYVPLIDFAEMLEMGQHIATIAPQLPWHIFRLLAEYKLGDCPQTDVGQMLELKQRVAGTLDYVYLENFAGSSWLNTTCPACGELLVKRISTGGCGADVLDVRLEDELCPGCGRRVHFNGEIGPCRPAAERPDPRTAFIDVGGWCGCVSMADGAPRCAVPENPLAEIVRANPYPGDLKPEADTWVSDMGLALAGRFSPDLMVLTYAQACFAGRHAADPAEVANICANLGRQVERFLESSGYEYLIVALGDLVQTRGTVNLEREFSGIVSADEGIGCLYGATGADAARIAQLEGVARVFGREDFSAWVQYSFDGSFGEYFVVPQEGYQLLGLSSFSRYTYRTGGMHSQIPVCSSIGSPAAIQDIRPTISAAVRAGKRVALIILDGIGYEQFPFGHRTCRNMAGDLPYASSQLQYMVISTGENVYPRLFAYPHWRLERRVNPFSRNCSFLDGCLTHDVMRMGKVAVSAGNRSIMTQMAFPADYTVECRCAGLHNYGTMGVIR